MGFDKFLHDTSQSEGTKSDLDKYLEEPLFPRSVDFNILNWWKVHTPRYPVLSMMARNVLATPMSKLSSEFAFSTERRMLDRDWSSLNPETVQALMCSQDWIRSQIES
nr:zinc finger bed domain-containing protein ricesleeper 2 [Quercus suber]